MKFIGLNDLLSKFGFGNRAMEKNYFLSRTQLIGGKGAVYIDTDTPYQLINSIPQLKLAIEKLGTMFSNGVLVLENIETGETIEDKELQALLEQPNFLQGQNEFLKQYITQLYAYGSQFIRIGQKYSLAKYPSSLLPISAANITAHLTGKLFNQTEMKGIVSHYEYTENGYRKRFEVDEIIWSRIPDLDNPLVGCSPIKSLRYPLTNTKYAYDYLNVISSDKGALGMLTSKAKDTMGSIPLTPEQRKEIEKQHRETYGTADGQSRILIGEAEMDWKPMSYPTKDLLLLDQIDANFKTILDVLGINPNIFINSTYENLRNGLIMTYQDTIIPAADMLAQDLSKALKVKKGTRITAKYDHISILQEDTSKQLDDIGKKSATLVQLVTAGIILNTQAEAIMANELKLLKSS